MDWLKANLDLLSVKQPELANHLCQISPANVEVFPSSMGLPTASYRRAGSAQSLHSRYNPIREAQHIIQKTDTSGADYFVFLGFGLGYLLDTLLDQAADPAANSYFVIESDMEILRAAFAARDLSRALSLPHLHFAWPATGPDLARQWDKFFDPVRAQKQVFISHPPSVALDPAHFKSAVEVIQSQTLQIYTDINTLVARSREFLANFVQNLAKARMAPGVSGFAGQFKGVPAVLVAAGPSLDKNIHELRSTADQLLVLSTDTALKPLLAAGIEPHFVLTGDPSHLNYLHLEGNRSREAYLVAEATTYPASLTEFEGRTIICTFENSALRAIAELLGSKGTLRAWGSVATMALDFALLLGCNPILFIGQDLAHSDGRIYCSGLHFEKEWFKGVVDSEGWERRLREIRKGSRTLILQDIFGRPVETTDKLVSYWNWISKEISNHPEIRFINATEGGILKEQVEIMSLREALFRHCGRNLDLRRRVKDAFTVARDDATRFPEPGLRIILQEAAELRVVLQKGLEICNDLSRTDPRSIFQQLERVKQDLYSHTHIAPIVDSLNQMGNVTFLRKQAALARQPIEEGTAEQIRVVYGEYFGSIQESLQAIDKALLEISKVLQDPPQESGHR